MPENRLTQAQRTALRRIPAIEQLLACKPFLSIQDEYSRDLVTEALREITAEVRTQILKGEDIEHLPDAAEYAERVRAKLDAMTSSALLPLVNVTGTITHTNLGRSLLSPSACESLVQAATNYVNLEYDLDTGMRGHRDRITEPLLRRLTGCEASTVVNNNAAAVLLALNTVAQGKEVIVSRGELIEIGGAFRIPDVMAASGAILREVGTTNRTHLRDYENAINDNTALLLKVHPSNYKIVGFSSTPEMEEITELGHRHGIPTMEDLGSGSLIDLTHYGLPAEPVVRERIAAGVDIVTFSGDKLLGGPQAGIIVGKTEWIQQIRKNPLMRALRVGKLTIAALEATLRLYLNESGLTEKLPMLHRYTRPIEDLREIAEHLADALRQIFGDAVEVTVENSYAQIGSGSLPVETLPSLAVVLKSRHISTEKLAAQFRAQPRPVIGRTQDGRLWMDTRTVGKAELNWIIEAAKGVSRGGARHRDDKDSLRRQCQCSA
ncbi:MAG: L-seryl-tRNA(Sec) selenium transferase [Candidatus Poribacteria bacterium]|nr:L-seryl-tRNA(Sec) selenium transferase [Candidatus Poribacteria bacterium]